MVLPLSSINTGGSAKILALANPPLMAEGGKEEVGFEPEEAVTCVLRKRKGNIAAYLVRGAVIALREEDSRMILVEALS